MGHYEDALASYAFSKGGCLKNKVQRNNCLLTFHRPAANLLLTLLLNVRPWRIYANLVQEVMISFILFEESAGVDREGSV